MTQRSKKGLTSDQKTPAQALPPDPTPLKGPFKVNDDKQLSTIDGAIKGQIVQTRKAEAGGTQFEMVKRYAGKQHETAFNNLMISTQAVMAYRNEKEAKQKTVEALTRSVAKASVAAINSEQDALQKFVSQGEALSALHIKIKGTKGVTWGSVIKGMGIAPTQDKDYRLLADRGGRFFLGKLDPSGKFWTMSSLVRYIKTGDERDPRTKKNADARSIQAVEFLSKLGVETKGGGKRKPGGKTNQTAKSLPSDGEGTIVGSEEAPDATDVNPLDETQVSVKVVRNARKGLLAMFRNHKTEEDYRAELVTLITEAQAILETFVRPATDKPAPVAKPTARKAGTKKVRGRKLPAESTAAKVAELTK